MNINEQKSQKELDSSLNKLVFLKAKWQLNISGVIREHINTHGSVQMFINLSLILSFFKLMVYVSAISL